MSHQLSWRAGEWGWEQRSISLCMQGNSQPISEGIDFFFNFFFSPPKGGLCSFSLLKGGRGVEGKNPLLFKYILYLFVFLLKCFLCILRKSIDNLSQIIFFTRFQFAKTLFHKRIFLCMMCLGLCM